MSERATELFELTKTLVNFESVTGHEKSCCEFLSGYLQKHGFEIELQPVTEGRANLFAKLGKPEVVLTTHMDTVPPFIPAGEDDEYIYGRGSCDAKGILASQVIAALELKASRLGDLGLLFVVGEETLSDGARKANNCPAGSKFIIDGEPTENKLAVGTKGNLRVDIRASGKTAHSAYPELGDSAIEKLLDVLAEMRKVPLPEDPVMGRATMNIGVIEGGHAPNVIPDSASAQILFRTVCPSAELRQKLEAILEGRCHYEFLRDTLPIRMEPIDGFETDVVAYSTDLPNLTRWGRPLLIGPGSIHVAHTDHECVRKSDLIRAVELYSRLVRELKNRV
ncbi:MAG: M20/M25/M40 family metallo-hydrolase [Acidobacteria bacterium]|nr:M20/M25/M40 family metallo-hydrolase [Acidobacteriota bacterium]